MVKEKDRTKQKFGLKAKREAVLSSSTTVPQSSQGFQPQITRGLGHKKSKIRQIAGNRLIDLCKGQGNKRQREGRERRGKEKDMSHTGTHSPQGIPSLSTANTC